MEMRYESMTGAQNGPKSCGSNDWKDGVKWDQVGWDKCVGKIKNKAWDMLGLRCRDTEM